MSSPKPTVQESIDRINSAIKDLMSEVLRLEKQLGESQERFPETLPVDKKKAVVIRPRVDIGFDEVGTGLIIGPFVVGGAMSFTRDRESLSRIKIPDCKNVNTRAALKHHIERAYSLPSIAGVFTSHWTAEQMCKSNDTNRTYLLARLVHIILCSVNSDPRAVFEARFNRLMKSGVDLCAHLNLPGKREDYFEKSIETKQRQQEEEEDELSWRLRDSVQVKFDVRRVVLDMMGSQRTFMRYMGVIEKEQGESISSLFPNAEFIMENKADLNYAIVALASLKAKQKLNQLTEELRKQYPELAGASGSASCKRTVDLLREAYKRDGKFPIYARHFWESFERMKSDVDVEKAIENAQVDSALEC